MENQWYRRSASCRSVTTCHGSAGLVCPCTGILQRPYTSSPYAHGGRIGSEHAEAHGTGHSMGRAARAGREIASVSTRRNARCTRAVTAVVDPGPRTAPLAERRGEPGARRPPGGRSYVAPESSTRDEPMGRKATSNEAQRLPGMRGSPRTRRGLVARGATTSDVVARRRNLRSAMGRRGEWSVSCFP